MGLLPDFHGNKVGSDLVRQYRIKIQQIRNELLRVQASILVDKTTGALYRLPSCFTLQAKRMDAVLGFKRSLTPSIFTT